MKVAEAFNDVPLHWLLVKASNWWPAETVYSKHTVRVMTTVMDLISHNPIDVWGLVDKLYLGSSESWSVTR